MNGNGQVEDTAWGRGGTRLNGAEMHWIQAWMVGDQTRTRMLLRTPGAITALQLQRHSGPSAPQILSFGNKTQKSVNRI